MRALMVCLGVGAALVIGAALFWPHPPPDNPEPPQPQTAELPPPTSAAPVSPLPPPAPAPAPAVAAPTPSESAPAAANPAERLAQLRETFRALAAGEPRIALQTARQLTNEVERETALLALVTEWKQGELAPPRQRACAIASLGLEAGLGLELAGNPELAQLWAGELTNRPAHAVALEEVAAAMVAAEPATAFAFAGQLNRTDRAKFLASAFRSWAGRDTEEALQWVDQLSDPAEREAAIKAIRSVAPVGIGAELNQRDGYTVVNRLFPGSPAELSGQLRAGDRILAVSQGNNVFVDAHGMSMQDVVQAIRGAPGTMVQLRILPADAPPDSVPRTVALFRGQLKLKR